MKLSLTERCEQSIYVDYNMIELECQVIIIIIPFASSSDQTIKIDNRKNRRLYRMVFVHCINV